MKKIDLNQSIDLFSKTNQSKKSFRFFFKTKINRKKHFDFVAKKKQSEKIINRFKSIKKIEKIEKLAKNIISAGWILHNLVPTSKKM